jgi:CelD/BcsL family acetyltransferase involved in cellulose biosynthesis
MSRLSVTEERGPAALASLRTQWQGLFARATNASAFLAWEWISAWHSRLGQGLMPRIFCARSGDALVGLLPLAEGPARGRVGRRVRLLSFLGERFVGGDYLDVLAEPALEHDAATAIFEHLARDQSFDALRLDGIAGDSLSLPLLTSRFGEDKAYEQSLLPYEVCPYRVLRGSGQAVIEASRRPHEFRRKLRQLAALPGFATAVVTRPDEVPAALERFFMLHERRWAGQGGSDAMARPSVKAFHRDAVKTLAITGAVRFEEIWAEGRCIASLYGIDRRERFFFYQCGYDPDWAKQSVGFVRLGLSLADAADRGVKVYDFLRGSEAYKFDWADGVRSTLSVRITRRNPAGRAFLAGENLRAAAKLTAKALLPTGAVDMIRRRRRRGQRNESPVQAGPVPAPMERP